MQVAIYARHSTDKQEHSTRDQLARCRAHCRKMGYNVTAAFCDEGISGASMQNRPGIREMVETALDGGFVRIVAEDLSRFSRDQGDVAHFYKKLLFLGIVLETIAEGEISELHIGLKGTMNALYLKDLADKTRRGMIGAVLNGAIPGGRTFGYDIVHRMNERGEPIPGLRKINPGEAAIVRQIFARYQAGASLPRICQHLNDSGLLSPKGSKWQPSALIGTFSRGTGILRNTLYKGVVTFDRMAYRKHPETGKRLSVVRPESEWIKVPAPELAIIEETEFDRVQELILERGTGFRERRLIVQVMTHSEKQRQRSDYMKVWRARQMRSAKPQKERALHLTSGKLWCGRHDTAFVHRRSRLIGCAEKGCANQNLPLDYILPLVMDDMRRFDGNMIIAHFHEAAKERDELIGELSAAELYLGGLRQKIRGLLDAIAKSHRGRETLDLIEEREKECARLRLDIDNLKARIAETEKPAEQAIDVGVRRFHHALARQDQYPAATKLLHGCIDRIRIIPKWNADEEAMQHKAEVAYNFPDLIKALIKESREWQHDQTVPA